MYAPLDDEDNPNYTTEGLLALRPANAVDVAAQRPRAVWDAKHRPAQWVGLQDEKDFALLSALGDSVGVEVRRITTPDSYPLHMVGLPTENLSGGLKGAWALARQVCNQAKSGGAAQALGYAGIHSGAEYEVCKAFRLCVPFSAYRQDFYEEQPDGMVIPVGPTEMAGSGSAPLAPMPIGVAHADPEPVAELTPLEREELVQLRREVQVLRNGQSDLAMGASIKLAAARMVLSKLMKDSRLDNREQAALRGVFDMLPAPSTGHIAAADALAREAQAKRIGGGK